jgi:anti-sigma B factor antagonist
MRIEIYRSGIYRIVKISDALAVISQLEELRSLIQGYLSMGENFLAIVFSDASYLYSGAIAVLISCYKMVRDKGGDLCIVEPKPEMLNLIRQMGIDQFISLYATEKDLPGDPRQIEDVRTDFQD